MSRSEWTQATAFERVLYARGSRTPVDNPPSVEAEWQIPYFKWYSRAEWEAERRGLLLWPHSS